MPPKTSELLSLAPGPQSSSTHLNWLTDKDNPRNWPQSRKFVTAFIICATGFTTTVGASIYSPGHTQVQHEFGVSETVALIPLSTYSLGLAFGPMISSPLSETFGRKLVYLITLPLFDIFLLASGFSKNIAALIICRFFAGVFAAPGVSVAAAVISDFTTPEQRVVPLAIYYSIPSLGSAIGPLVGGFAAQERGWRWTSWVVLMMAAVVHPMALFLRESYKPKILQCRARQEGTTNPQANEASMMKRLRTFITSTIIRPLHMLTTEPLVGFICMYTSFQFSLLYTFIVASPWVFKTVYGFTPTGQALSFLGMICGYIVAPSVLISLDYGLRKLERHRASQNTIPDSEPHADPTSDSTFTPETRLRPALYGSLVLPIGIFWFGWSARSSVHWICPIIAQCIAFIGSYLIYTPCSFYMVDVYGAQYSASANGASSFSRYTLCAAFPLFVTQMYEKLGVGWASSLLGFVAVAMAPIPWVFYRFGPKFRARSSYEHGT